jgi:tetratricopeptide (TPR) repeat protein
MARRRQAALACALLGGTALAAAVLMAHPVAGWIVLNLLLWAPATLLLLVLARESARALLARLLGFHVFEIQWGAGRVLFSQRIGSCVLRLAALPLLGHVEAATTSPRRHRMHRWAIACAPALLQLALFVSLHRSTLLASEPAASAGLAPLAVVEAANLLVLALHLLLPFETPSGLRTDVRRAFDLLDANPERDRAERAVGYVGLVCQQIRREDCAGARELLDRGLRALGPEPVLLDLGRRLDRFECSGVAGASFRFEDPRASIRARAASEHAARRLSHRLTRAATASLPILLVLASVAMLERDRWVEAVELSWSRTSLEVATLGEPEPCRDALDRWSAWGPRLDAIHTPDRALRRARLDAIAHLHGCLGETEMAMRHQREAVAVALAQTSTLEARESDGATRLAAAESAIVLARQRRRLAHWHAERGAYRESLATLEEARNALELAQGPATPLDEAGEADSLRLDARREDLEIELARAQVLGRIGAFEQARRIYQDLLADLQGASSASPEPRDGIERVESAWREAERSWPARMARSTPGP